MNYADYLDYFRDYWFLAESCLRGESPKSQKAVDQLATGLKAAGFDDVSGVVEGYWSDERVLALRQRFLDKIIDPVGLNIEPSKMFNRQKTGYLRIEGFINTDEQREWIAGKAPSEFLSQKSRDRLRLLVTRPIDEIEYLGSFVVGYVDGTVWIGLFEDEAQIAHLASLDPNKCARAIRRTLSKIKPFPQIQRLPCLDSTPDTGGVHIAFRPFERNPTGFERFCQSLVRNILAIPEDEYESRTNATCAPQYIDDLDAKNEFRPEAVGDHEWDQLYTNVAIPVRQGEIPLQIGSLIAIHLRYIGESANTAEQVVAELEANNRVSERLNERPNYIVITSNIDETALLGWLADHFGSLLSKYPGSVFVLGRSGILDAIHGHYGIHREAIGHPMDEKLLAKPFLSLPIGTTLHENPGTLLQAKFGLVRFDRAIRQEALERLQVWLDDETPVSVLLVAGPGGAGKTRLVAEFLKENDRLWKTGMIRDRASIEQMSTLAHTREPIICAIDYGETNTETLHSLLEEATTASRALPLKLLVTTRSIGDWWNHLEKNEFLREVVGKWEPISLDSERLNTEARARLFDQAVIDYSRAITGKRLQDFECQALEEDHFASPLYVLMAALLAVYRSVEDDSSDTPLGREELLEETLNHERKYWRKAIEPFMDDLRIHHTVRGCFERIVTAIALVGGIQNRELSATLIDCLAPECRRTWDQLPRRVSEVLTQLYPGYGCAPTSQGAIAALQPDPLADYLIGSCADVQLLIQIQSCNAVKDEGALIRSLNRAATASPKAMVLLKDFLPRLFEDPKSLKTAIDVAGESGGALSALLPEALREVRNASLVEQMARLIPFDTSALREAGIVASERTLRYKVTQFPNPRPAQAAEVAELAANLSIRLSAVGLHAEALNVAEWASHVFRDLSRGETNNAATIPGCRFTNTWGTPRVEEQPEGSWSEAWQMFPEQDGLSHGWLGEYEETPLLKVLIGFSCRLGSGERASSFRRDEYLPQFAISLSNLGFRLGDMGRFEDALSTTAESALVLRELNSSYPGAHLSDLGKVLSNLGVCCSDLHRHEEALMHHREALAIRRKIAKEQPTLFHRSELAHSLSNLGKPLGALRRHAEATGFIQEAVDIYRDLAKTKPDIYRQPLARVLSNQGSNLGNLGRNDEALAPLREAVEIRRELVLLQPEGFKPELARSLYLLGNNLGHLQRFEEAIAPIEEAAEIFEELEGTRPGFYQSDLARSISNLGAIQSGLGRHEEAIRRLEEAVEILRGLERAQPNAYQADLAITLANLGGELAEQNRLEEALPSAEEAIVRYAPIFDLPGESTSHMQEMVEVWQRIAEQLNRKPDPELLEPILKRLGRHSDDAEE